MLSHPNKTSSGAVCRIILDMTSEGRQRMMVLFVSRLIAKQELASLLKVFSWGFHFY